MFDSSLYSILVKDTELVNLLSEYRGQPSIFSNHAGENVDFPYIVFRIYGTGGQDHAVDSFQVNIGIFEYGESAKNARLIARKVEEILDLEHLDHEYYDTIRLFRRGTDFVEGNEDPRAQQYNISFTARAGRSGWMVRTLK